MAYKALYRTWRPEQFSEVVGQDHIVKVLTGQVAAGKTAHAYLFAGPRGTGKTSLAKIFAKAINCTDRQGAEPCGKCSVCLETMAENAVDIVEIDAASNNGVDSVRDLRDRVNLLPAFCSYKVYIIDEVHMLSKGAFNALLKTLEEPPEHVIFILATTEPHKLPATIRSRCQRFDFRRIPADVIAKRLAKVAESEKYVYAQDALDMIARAAEGGMRDALSILDQCAAFGDITVQNVAGSLGGTDSAMLLSLVESISSYDEKNALMRLREIILSGADTRTLIKDLAEIFRNMMWICTGAETADIDKKLKEYALLFEKNACVRALDLLIKKEYEMRQNLRADIVLETAVMAIMCPEDDAQPACAERIEKLEARLSLLEENRGRVLPPNDTAQYKKHEKKEKQETKKPEEKTEKQEAPKQSETAEKISEKSDADVHDVWDKLLTHMKKEAYFIFTHAKKAKDVLCIGNILEIKYDSADEIAADYLKKPSAQKTLLKMLESISDKPLSISIIIEKQHAPSPIDEDVLKMFGSNIEEI